MEKTTKAKAVRSKRKTVPQTGTTQTPVPQGTAIDQVQPPKTELSANKVLDLLAAQEGLIRTLYTVYAEKFSDYAYFWNNLADEEMMHAGWIKALRADCEAGEVRFNPARFQPKALETTRDYLNDQIASARKDDITMLQATSIARDIERSLIENRFFEVFESDSIRFRTTMDGLAKATMTHLEWTQEMWGKFNRHLNG